MRRKIRWMCKRWSYPYWNNKMWGFFLVFFLSISKPVYIPEDERDKAVYHSLENNETIIFF